MRRFRGALAALLLAGCTETAPVAKTADAPASRGPRDYEGMARKLYAQEPGYEEKWPVEFHIRICEGITQDLNRAIKDLGGNIGAELFAEQTELVWGVPGPEEPL